MELRKIVYITNVIESINFQLCKITKNRGYFPDKDAARIPLHNELSYSHTWPLRIFDRAASDGPTLSSAPSKL